MFGQMYIACQSRDGDINEFFRHENQSSPPALAERGMMRSCTKSDLVTCLEKQAEPTNTAPDVTAKILDGSAIVHMLAPRKCKTFHDYAEKVFVPYIVCQL